MPARNRVISTVKCLQTMNKNICDRNGAPLEVGSKIRLVSIPAWLLSRVSEEEVIDLNSMIGEVFTVSEIDKWGGVWVEKWFTESENEKHSHSLSLSSEEMEIVELEQNT